MTDTSKDTPTTAGATAITGNEAPAPVPAGVRPAIRSRRQPSTAVRRPRAASTAPTPPTSSTCRSRSILGSITAVEVAVSYLKGLGDAGAPLLLILAAAKFFLVASYFMHLKFDTPVLRRIFVTGIVLAITVYVVVFFTLGIFTTNHGVHG